MGALGTVTLGSLRLQAQQRADMVNSPFVSVTEWNQYLNQSYKDLYDLLVTAYGTNYYMARPYVFSAAIGGSISGQGVLYPLPDGLTTIDALTGSVAPPFYKGLGVDMQAGTYTNPNNWVTLDRFNFNERNRYGFIGTGGNSTVYGLYQIKYAYQGTNIWLTPVPAATVNLQLWYIPEPTNLQVNLNATQTLSSGVLTLADTSQLAVGMSVQLLGVSTATYPIASLTTGSVILTGYSAAATGPVIVTAWSDSTTFDGISGWEDYIVVGAAIKAMNKQESNVDALAAELGQLKQRITDASAVRDAGKPDHASPPTDRNWGGRGRGRYDE